MKKVTNKKNMTIDNLAIMVAKGFESVDKRFDGVDKRFESVDKDIADIKIDLNEVKENLKATRRDVLDLGDRFVPRHEFDNLLIRFGRIERKLQR
ncbi:MAG TPA: hypothetical protein VMR49_02225 [Candidatus Paceibacterota bacterium]|nr:hypothetical protein [Candidatus Paceibacterota bacterium]